jgi:acetamidase/formamidase
MTVHRIGVERGTVHGRFNPSLPPLLTIEPGDTVIYQTLDASWGHRGQEWFAVPMPELNRDRERDQGHALSGPIAVRGAEPGAVLEIEIVAIRPGSWGWTWAGPLQERERQYTDLAGEAAIGWRLDAEAGTATDIHGYGIALPLHPFMGVMGNAPAEPGDHATVPPRRVGGNLDCRELVAGSILWLPVEVEGALFSVGDGHGTQGDGEIGSTAVECPMEHVELTFRVRKEMRLDAPRAQTPGGLITVGLGSSLDDAARQAIAGMLDYLQETFGLERAEAGVLASLVVDLRVTQVVNRTVGVHAVLPPDAFTVNRPNTP